MRILYRNFIFFVAGCLLPSALLVAQPQKLYLNPATAGAARQSEFVDITRFIPIDAAAGKIKNYVSLFITREYWVLFDSEENKLTFLDKQGRFVKTIGIKKYGNARIVYDDKNEVLKFNIRNKNYTLIDKDLVKIRAAYSKKSNQKYFKNYVIDLKESSLQIRRTPADPYFIINANRYYGDYFFLVDLNTDPGTKDTAGFELEVLHEHKRVQAFFPYNKATDRLYRYTFKDASLEFSDTDTAYIKYISRPFNTTIYKLNRDSMQAMYEIILPAENAFPASLYQNGFKSRFDWTAYRNSHGAVFSSIDAISNSRNYLFFGLSSMRNYQSFLYDKKAAKFYNSAKIKADSSQFNIHLIENGPENLYKGKYYKVVSAQSLLEFYEKNSHKKIDYPAELELFFKTATKNTNPVIVEYILKDEFR